MVKNLPSLQITYEKGGYRTKSDQNLIYVINRKFLILDSFFLYFCFN